MRINRWQAHAAGARTPIFPSGHRPICLYDADTAHWSGKEKDFTAILPRTENGSVSGR